MSSSPLSSSVDANKALIQRYYDDLFNRGRLALADDLVDTGVVDHAAPAGAGGGPDGVRRVVALLRAAFPDNRHVIEDLIAEGDRVVARVTFRGTHAGPYRGIAPTGARITQAQIHIFRIVAGKVAEHWVVRDDLGLMRALGQAAATIPTTDESIPASDDDTGGGVMWTPARPSPTSERWRPT